MARLGDIVTISPSTLKNAEERVWLLNLDMVEQKTGDILAYNYVSRKELNGSIIQFDTGNVLYSKLRPNLNKVVLPLQAGYATSEMLPLRPNVDTITREYLTAYLRSSSFVTWATSKTAGAKMPRLSTKDLLDKDIPLPSLTKQRQIGAITTCINQLIFLYRRRLTKLDELIKARFAEMFVGQYPTVVLGDVIETTSGGTPSSRIREYYEYGNIPWLTSGEINQSQICSTANYITEEGLKNSSAKWVPKNSVVIAMYGATAGKASILRIPATTNQAVCTLIPNDKFDVDYLCYAVKSCEMWMVANRSGAAQPNLSQAIIKKMKLTYAPIDEQRKFARFAHQLEKSKTAVQSALDKAQLLFDSLMQKYFG